MGSYARFPLKCFSELLGAVLWSHPADSPLSCADPIVCCLFVPVTAPAACVHQEQLLLSLGNLCFLQRQLWLECFWTGRGLSGVFCSRCVCMRLTRQLEECAINKDEVGYSV